MTNHQLINQTSGDVEYYTPILIVEAARRTMGGIDLDPFSSRTANNRIAATSIYTVEDDGFAQPWFGRVFCNHPFGRTTNPRFSAKLVEEIRRGQIEALCCITFAATSEKWFRPLLAIPQCFLTPRLNYVLPSGAVKRGVTKGSVVSYYGKDVHRFVEKFSQFGVVKLPCMK